MPTSRFNRSRGKSTKTNVPPNIDSIHREANWKLVPFVARLFQEPQLKLPARGDLLTNPKHLTEEARDHLADIMNQGVWLTLCREDGWREIESLDHPAGATVWAAETPALRFGPEAISFCTGVYVHVQPNRGAAPPLGSLTWSDCLLIASLYRTLRRQPQVSHLFLNQPLIVLRFPIDVDAEGAAEQINGLLASEVLAFLPWISYSWAADWMEDEALRWPASVKEFTDIHDRLAGWLGAWVEAVVDRGRPDLLQSVLHYFSQLASRTDFDQWAYNLEVLGGDLRMGRRRELANVLVTSLAPARRMAEVYKAERSVHPVEREPAGQVFMAAYERLAFDQALEALNVFAESIAPTIG